MTYIFGSMREDILETKREKLTKLIEARGTAYPEKAERTHEVSQLLDQFDALNGTEEKVSIVGRVRSLRVMGKIAFAHIKYR